MASILSSNGYINIIDIQYGIIDRIKTTTNNRYKKIYYNGDKVYFIENKIKYDLSDFFRI